MEYWNYTANEIHSIWSLETESSSSKCTLFFPAFRNSVVQVFHSITPHYGYIPQASQARVASMYEEELDLQHPLYAVHGYDEKQVR